jgi:hypothetical protein
VFGADDYLGMLTAILSDARDAGMVIRTRNDDAADGGTGAWVIEIAGAQQTRTPAGLHVGMRTLTAPADTSVTSD